jgi:purine catabolism regulator
MQNDPAVVMPLRDILKMSHFKDASVIAGHDGLDISVRWLHIMEINPHVGKWVDGFELLLTTGVGYTGDTSELINFMNQIITKNVSGLCIVLGTYVSEIPLEMIEIANRNSFPLIVVQEQIRFLDVSHDINMLLLQKGSGDESLIEDFFSRFNTLLLSAHSFEDLLINIHKNLKINIVYIPFEKKAVFLPNFPQQKHKEILSHLDVLFSIDDPVAIKSSPYGVVVHERLIAMDYQWGELFFFFSGLEITTLQKAIVDRITILLTQDLFRSFYAENKKTNEENEWIKKWLQGTIDDDELSFQLDELDLPAKLDGLTACVLEFPHKKSVYTELINYTSLILKHFFLEQGFSVITYIDNHQLISVLFDFGKESSAKQRVKAVLDRFRKVIFQRTINPSIYIGIGYFVNNRNEIIHSFNSAQEAISIQKKLMMDEPFYDNLDIYPILFKLEKLNNFLPRFIDDHLGTILRYDEQHSSDLFLTLKTFYECNCSKQKAADKLFIVRQTMYQRFQKLESLLGKDFTASDKRVSVELAIHAYEYLQKTHKCII